MIVKYLFAVLVSLLSNVLLAQQRPFRKYTPRDGLGHSIVYRTTQTKDGVLWFSTDNGLTRYDGTFFKNFASKDGLGSNFIFGLLESDTALLISSFGAGIASYKANKGITINSYSANVLYPIIIQHNRAGLWVTDRTHALYKFTGNGFNVCYTGKKEASPFYKMIETSTGEILTGQGNGIYQLTHGSESFKALRIKGWPVNGACYSLLELPDRNLLAATDHHIYHISLRDSTARPILDGHFFALTECLFRDHEDYIWISNQRGELWKLTPDLKHKEKLLTGVIVTHIFEDADFNIWISTYGLGVFCLPNLHILKYLSPEGMQVTDLLYDPTLNVPFIASPNKEVTTLKDGRIQNVGAYPSILRKRHISVISHPGKTEYLAGAFNSLYRLIGKKNIDSILVYAPVASLYKSSTGDYWAGLRTGLCKVDRDFKKAEHLQEFSTRFVRSITEDSNGRILIGTDRGVYRMQDGAWQLLDQEDSLPNSYINVIQCDSIHHGCWVGTNEGICKLEDDNSVTTFSHPFAQYRCNSIITDRSGVVWVGTSNGLVKYTGNSFHLYNEKDGVPDDIYKLAYSERHDELYLLASDNLSVVEAGKFQAQQSPVVPGIILRSIQAEETPIQYVSQVVGLQDAPRYLHINYSIPHYKNSKAWSIGYRINNEPWSVTDDLNQLTINNLPFGEFQIAMKVINDNQKESAITLLSFNNIIPFYRTTWFAIVSGISVLSLVVFVTKFMVQRQSRKKERAFQIEKQRIRLEQKVLRLQMNPHFLFNSLMAIQTFILKKESDIAGHYLSEFAKLTRLILENSRQDFIPLEKEIETLKYYLDLQQLRFREKFQYQIITEGARDAGYIKIPPMLSQPFIENSIEHGIIHSCQTGSIRITYNIGENKILFTVEDNGAGLGRAYKFKRSDEHRSLATTITLERLAKFYNGKPELASLQFNQVKDAEGNVKGTRVSFYIPI